MAAYSKILLSGSSQGRGVKVVATATAGTTIHTTGTSATVIDEITLEAQNNHTADVVLTIEFGDATAPDHNIVVTIPTKGGLQLVVASQPLTGDGATAATVKAFASVANVISLYGFVNRIS